MGKKTTLTALLVVLLATVAYAEGLPKAAKDAIKKRDTAIAAAKKKYEADVKKANDAALRSLKFIKNREKRKSLERAAAVQIEIDKLEGNPTTVQKAKKTNKRKATLYMRVNGRAEMYHNGRHLCNSRGMITQKSIEVADGDIFSVKLEHTGLDYGFVAILVFKNDICILTNQKTWKGYTPSDEDAWYDIKGAKPRSPRKGTDSDLAEDIKDLGLEKAKIMPLWDGKLEKGYLYLKVSRASYSRLTK